MPWDVSKKEYDQLMEATETIDKILKFDPVFGYMQQVISLARYILTRPTYMKFFCGSLCGCFQ